MTERVRYYAIVDDRSSEEEPAGVLRHFPDGDHRDQSFGADLEWKFSPLRHAVQHGDTEYELIVITEERATWITERISARRHQLRLGVTRS